MREVPDRGARKLKCVIAQVTIYLRQDTAQCVSFKQSPAALKDMQETVKLLAPGLKSSKDCLRPRHIEISIPPS